MLPGLTAHRSNQFDWQGASQLGPWLDVAWRVLLNGLAELPCGMACPGSRCLAVESLV